MTSSSSTVAPGLARVLRAVESLRAEYLSARPWPHLVLTDVFAADVLQAAAAEIRAMDPAVMAVATTPRMVKRETGDVGRMGPATREVLAVLDDEPFLGFLRDLTGIDDLVCDPTHHWAGVHATPPGGFTMVHADFRDHPETGLWHRSNVLLYLNEEWAPEWGGQLELWPSDMKALGRSIEPLAGTLVIFETHATTMHGLPAPVDTPDGRSRISLAAYQYSTHPQPAANRRLSKYAPRPSDSWTLRIPSRWDLKERVPKPIRRLGSAVLRRGANG